MSVKTSIGWTDMTLNPIKGLCQGGCWYCYYSGKRGIARRFKQDPELRLDLSALDRLPKAPKKVFLCSTNDYCGGWVSDGWREAIREETQKYPQHIFQVLTKQYYNLPKYSPYPQNWWIGTTATDFKQWQKAADCLTQIQARVKFISFEPLLEDIGSHIYPERLSYVGINWVIIGRLTGYGHKYDPKIEYVEEIVRACDKAGVPVFLKNNLANVVPFFKEPFKQETMGDDGIKIVGLRQEFPE